MQLGEGLIRSIWGEAFWFTLTSRQETIAGPESRTRIEVEDCREGGLPWMGLPGEGQDIPNQGDAWWK